MAIPVEHRTKNTVPMEGVVPSAPEVPVAAPVTSGSTSQGRLDTILDHVCGKMSYGQLMDTFPLSDNIQDICLTALRNGIHPRFWSMLNVMTEFDFTFIVDNSGSMSNFLSRSWVCGGLKTRYDELRSGAGHIVEIIAAIDDDGFDLYTLNKVHNGDQVESQYGDFGGSRFVNICDPRQVENIFSTPPHGRTPLNGAVNAALHDHEMKNNGKPLMLLISTDGCPTDGNSMDDARRQLERTIHGRNRGSVFVTFIACSDMDDDIDFLDAFDDPPRYLHRTNRSHEQGSTGCDLNLIDGVETISRFRTERRQVHGKQGRKFPYSKGDHHTRMICAPVFPILDKLDQERMPDSFQTGEDFIPQTIYGLITKMATDDPRVHKKMHKYAQNNHYIREALADVPHPTKGCVVM